VDEPYNGSLGERTKITDFIWEGKIMIDVTKKAADMIKEFLKNQQGPGTVRILSQSC
jgi:hypothetical protein